MSTPTTSSRPSSALLLSSSAHSDISITVPRSSVLHCIVPKSNIQALYTYRNPHFTEFHASAESSRPSTSRSSPRESINPHHPTGNSITSTEKTDLLVKIMRNDPMLSRDGIRILHNRTLHVDINDHLLDKLEFSSDPAFINVWTCSLVAESSATEYEVLTDEVVTTGFRRATFHAHANRFLRHPSSFTEAFRPSTAGVRFGDPPTIVASRADVGCWHRLLCIHCGEHKRNRVCSKGHLNVIQSSAGSFRARDDEGLHIMLEGDQLRFRGWIGGDDATYVKCQRLVVQVRHPRRSLRLFG